MSDYLTAISYFSPKHPILSLFPTLLDYRRPYVSFLQVPLLPHSTFNARMSVILAQPAQGSVLGYSTYEADIAH